jgi:hypothetical protein
VALATPESSSTALAYPTSGGPPRLYSWTIVERYGDAPHLGALGVSDNRRKALSAMTDALQVAPTGSFGIVHQVTVSLAGVGYWYDSEVVRAQVDPVTGAVQLGEFPAAGGWGHLDLNFPADAFPALGQAERARTLNERGQ